MTREQVVPVAPGAWAHLQLPGRWMVSNSGLVVGQETALFVDTTSTERRTRAMLARLEPLAGSRRRWLLLTHHHGDHTFGAHLVGAELIIGHPAARAALGRDGLVAMEVFKGPDYGDVAVTLPQVLVEESAQLDLGDRMVTLFHPGTAHTEGDLVAWLPEERVLFAGDVAFDRAHPMFVHGSVHGYVSAVGRLIDLEPEVVVPGHGEVRGPELLVELRDYAEWVLELASDAIGDGLSPLEAAHAADLGRYAEWGEPERLAANLHRACAELTGAAPDSKQAMEDMVEHAGGSLPTEA